MISVEKSSISWSLFDFLDSSSLFNTIVVSAYFPVQQLLSNGIACRSKLPQSSIYD